MNKKAIRSFSFLLFKLFLLHFHLVYFFQGGGKTKVASLLLSQNVGIRINVKILRPVLPSAVGCSQRKKENQQREKKCHRPNFPSIFSIFPQCFFRIFNMLFYAFTDIILDCKLK